MQALDYEVIQHLVTWLDEGSQPWLFERLGSQWHIVDTGYQQ